MWKTCLFCCVFVMASVGLASTPGTKPISNLELRLQPEDLQYGLPQTFTFLLVNVSDHDVRVPVVPIVDCMSELYGEIELRWQLIGPFGQGISRGCPVNALRGHTIQDRVSRRGAPFTPGSR